MRRIALLSDIHDRVDHLAAVLDALARQDGPVGGCGALLFLGDLCSPFVLAQLAEGFGGPVHVVFGNNDADTFRMTRLARDHDHVTLHGEFAAPELAGRRVAMTHFPAVAEALDPRAFELIAYGHDHRFRIAWRGGAHLVNPGPLMGWDPGARSEVAASFALWDLAAGEVRGFRVEGDAVAPHGGA